MSETTPEQYDPSAYTVAEVNEYLTTVDDAERDRILQSETEGKARVGILDAAHPQADEPTDARTDQQDTERAQGFLGDRGETPEGIAPVLPASESAPSDVDTDPSAGVVIANGENLKFDPPATMDQQEAPSLEGEPYQQGYLGTLPDADNRPDLTLQGVLKGQA